MKKCILCILLSHGCLWGYAQIPTVAEIQFVGAKKSHAPALHKLLGQLLDTPLDSSQIQRDVARLKRLPAIANANFEVVETGNKKVKINYLLEEHFTLIPFANVFATDDDEFAFRIGLQEFNFLGRNIILGGFFQRDIFNSYGFHFRAPYLFSSKVGISLSYTDLVTQEPVFPNGDVADYRYNNRGFEVLGLYAFNDRHNLEVGGSLFTEDYQYLSGATDPNVPLHLNIDKRLLKGIYTYNALTYHYHYLEGIKNTLNMQYVTSTDSQLPDFVIGFNDLLYFKRVGKWGNWANRLRLGLASNMKTPFAPFAVDNNLNIRGVGNTIDRGTGAIVLNTEYRHTLFEKKWFVMQGNVFVDGGSWRNPGGDFGDFGDIQNIRVYPGVGFRFIHKRIFNAIFRIDYGHGITQDAARGIVFGIGQYF